MSKRKADDIAEAATLPQAKHPRSQVPGLTLIGEHNALPMTTTPPPDDDTIQPADLESGEEASLIARLEASQTALVRHLGLKYQRLQAVAPRSASTMESRLAKVADAMTILNQELDAMRAAERHIKMDSHSLQLHARRTCHTGHTTYFAPHQYVPLPGT